MAIERKVVVPEGMLQAAVSSMGISNGYEQFCATHKQLALPIIEAALRWLDEKLKAMMVENKTLWQAGRNATIEDVRRMFLVPESEPQGVDDLLVSLRGCSIAEIDERIREAHRRGLKQGSNQR